MTKTNKQEIAELKERQRVLDDSVDKLRNRLACIKEKKHVLNRTVELIKTGTNARSNDTRVVVATWTCDRCGVKKQKTYIMKKKKQRKLFIDHLLDSRYTLDIQWPPKN